MTQNIHTAAHNSPSDHKGIPIVPQHYNEGELLRHVIFKILECRWGRGLMTAGESYNSTNSIIADKITSKLYATLYPCPFLSVSIDDSYSFKTMTVITVGSMIIT